MMINRRRVCGGGKSLPQGAVDMGLPSGTLWAQGNIVKDANDNYAIGEPNDYGCYFSWGNIDGHNKDYYFDQTNYNASPGASLTGSIQANDALHDAAVARIGGGWHMPTKENFQELFNSNNCIWEWSTINGTKGLLLTSRTNGNTLFIPASGQRTKSTFNGKTTTGYYWSSSFYGTLYAYSLLYYSSTVKPADRSTNRLFGLSIRPVITT